MESVIDLTKANDVLIIKPSSFGDVLHTLPALHFLRLACPEIPVRWLVNTEWKPLLQDHPLLNEVIEFPRREFRGLGNLPKLRSWCREYRSRYRPDVVLDFQGLLRSALLGKISRAPHRVGPTNSREGARFFYNHCIPVDPNAHAVDRNLAMIRACGVAIEGPVRFPIGPGEQPRQADQLPARFLLLHPFSRGDGKSLSVAQVAAFCQRFEQAGIPVVLVGMGDGAGLESSGVINLLNETSLAELIWLVRKASFVLSVDSGPMHLAAALESPLVGIHTWSNPARVGPYGEGENWVWKAGRVAHRQELTPAELLEERAFTDEEVSVVADFIKERFPR